MLHREREELLFVNRERERARIAGALAEGLHVVVAGAYGIGRTSLVRNVAESMGDRWRFIFLDFEKPAAKLCRSLFAHLFPHPAPHRKHQDVGYSGLRFRLTNWEPDDPRRQVLVLDNIAAVSRQKLRLIGDLAATKRFSLVPIVESFLPGANLEQLRARLVPAPLVRLENLSYSSARRYFSVASERYALGWSTDRIAAMAEATRGYPLGMWQSVERGIRRRG